MAIVNSPSRLWSRRTPLFGTVVFDTNDPPGPEEIEEDSASSAGSSMRVSFTSIGHEPQQENEQPVFVITIATRILLGDYTHHSASILLHTSSWSWFMADLKWMCLGRLFGRALALVLSVHHDSALAICLTGCGRQFTVSHLISVFRLPGPL